MKKSLILTSLLLAGTSAVANNTNEVSKILSDNNVFMGIELGTIHPMTKKTYKSTSTTRNYQIDGDYSSIGLKIGTYINNDMRVYFTKHQVNSTDDFDIMSLSFDKILNTSSDDIKIFTGATYSSYDIEKIEGNALMINLGIIIKSKNSVNLEIGYQHSLTASGTKHYSGRSYSRENEKYISDYEMTALNRLYFGVNIGF